MAPMLNSLQENSRTTPFAKNRGGRPGPGFPRCVSEEAALGPGFPLLPPAQTLLPLFSPAGRFPARPATQATKVSVAILGAGHGGLALAGYLARQGHRVALW